MTKTCEVAECDRTHKGHGLCHQHLKRWRRSGVRPTTPLRQYATDEVGYDGAHLRIRRVRGAATEYVCADCGQTADQWSYKGGSERERVEVRQGREVPYSPDVYDYDPRCFSCHTIKDHGRR